MSQTIPDVSGTVFDDPTPELTRVYSEALLGAGDSSGETTAALDELEEFVSDLWRDQPDLAAMLSSPAVPVSEKDRILAEALTGRVIPITLHFLRVLNRHGRMGLLPAVVQRARAGWDRRQGRRHVFVRTAVALDAQQSSALSSRLAEMLGSTPVLQLQVDPELIGGIVLQVGDHVFDASVRTQHLERLRHRLTSERTHEILSLSASFTEL